MRAGKRKGLPIMTRTRRILAGLLATIGLLSAAGCADGQTGNGKNDGPVPEYNRYTSNGDQFSHKTVRLPDGRQVDCVVFEAHYKGGLSCDWDHAIMR